MNFEIQRREHVIEICLHQKNKSVEEILIQRRYQETKSVKNKFKGRVGEVFVLQAYFLFST